MSHRNPLEALEPRTLLSVALPPEPPTDPGIHVIGRTVYVNGTGARDFIRILNAPASGEDERPGQIQVQVNAMQPVFHPGNMERFIIRGNEGDDVVRIDAGLHRTFHPNGLVIFGGDGNDSLTGSERNDRIDGGAGDDLIVGFTGNDQLRGGAGNDRLLGGYGTDALFGDDGNDVLIGGPGNDRLLGGAGDDTFRNRESDFERQFGFRDLLDGGGGNDLAEDDPFDSYRLITGRTLIGIT